MSHFDTSLGNESLLLSHSQTPTVRNFIARPPLLNELYEKTVSILLQIRRKIMIIEMKDGAIESSKHTYLLLSE